ncbi:hypothetical protein LMG24235_08643 [Paraburkholderia sabiae]|nr:hypothetical protein LMG24235_08643 [Paraburkholderia sabiae]
MSSGAQSELRLRAMTLFSMTRFSRRNTSMPISWIRLRAGNCGLTPIVSTSLWRNFANTHA